MANLAPLTRRAYRKLSMQARAAASLAGANHAEADAAASRLTIDALNTWGEFVRAYLVCALEGGRTLGGNRVRTTFPKGTTLEAALRAHPKLLKRLPGARLTRRDEPTWFSKAVILDVFSAVGVTTLSQVRAALSLPSRSIDDLPTLRNFYAHRNEETADKARRLARRYGLAAPRHPTELVRIRLLRRSATLLEDWLFELAEIVDTMSR